MSQTQKPDSENRDEQQDAAGEHPSPVQETPDDPSLEPEEETPVSASEKGGKIPEAEEPPPVPLDSGNGNDGGDGDDGSGQDSADASADPPAIESTEDAQEDADDGKDELQEPMSFFDHMTELRIRLVRCLIAAGVGFLACYGFHNELFALLMKPLVAVFPPGSSLIYTGLPEAFFTYIKVSMVAGVLLVSPYIFYQIWSFIAPGLYHDEKKYLIPIAFFSGIFFAVGAIFGYSVVFPFAFGFFMEFATETIKPMPSLKEYLSFSLKLLFAFGFTFELPLFAFFLGKLGIINAPMLRKVRKYAYLCAFIVAAILTPPDIVSQVLMAGPLIVLFEISIWVVQMFGRKKKQQDEEENEEDTSESKIS